MGTISVRQLNRAYSGKIAVSDLSFEIPKGRITGLLGPNGAGKTTTLRLLTGYLLPTSGSIRFDGRDFLENKIEIQKQIGYLPESSPIYFDLTVFEYLSFLASAKGIEKNFLKNRVEIAVELLNLKEVLYRPISFLSKGFKQRVSLAGSIIQDPEYIILDEPSGGLDPLQIGELKSLIRTLGKNKTILFSSHVLQEVEEICDHILVLSEGKLIADASVSSISKGEGCLVLAEASLEEFSGFFPEKTYEIQKTDKKEEGFQEFKIRSSEFQAEEVFGILKKVPFRIRSLIPEKNSLGSVFETLTGKSKE
ncbi:ABC transporter ATP-binding protein [Leptospira stimsonii]|uniref:ATP-binding cassette domain-containing protein n=1 Tax=Leptospira stimsonii TaxID=2202203 RepID=A0ABY2MUR4_9LEPT|nr:ABC transporter ATP-binding protein [Leptospira stimsonii]TGK25285.1 ATP-binding cassette domain-containing protein [Leptospira stimsonii]TGM08704.1 ATP-binding cassette domain-containing protein [Leptospira stimsonii]